MEIIPQRELRNHVADVLRRVELGEQFTVTVSGRPVAQLSPLSKRTWVSGDQLREVWKTPAPKTLLDDLAQFPGEMTDPFE
jgi:prevent-host-death family protein